MSYELHNGDCLEVMRGLPDNSVDAVVTDPPYGLSFMGKKWDYDVPSVDVWAECLRILKPGGHILVACGTRTQHRMAVNIEDAGFEIRDTVAWLYGSGFPKSLDVSKAIDKSLGVEREVVGKADYTVNDKRGGAYASTEATERPILDVPITCPATESAKQWQGWGTALKPAFEAWTLARKPIEGGSVLVYNIREVANKICQYLLPATTAELSSKSSRNGSSEDVGIARWSADGSISTLEDLRDLTDMLRSGTMVNTNLNIVWLWLSILDGIWNLANTSTTETQSSLITELRILNSLEWANIFQSITQANDRTSVGESSAALDAVSLFNVLRLKLSDTLTPTVPESASLGRHDPSVAMELWTLARKPFKGTVAQNVLTHGTGAINIDGCRVGTEVLPIVIAGQARIGTFERGVMVTPERTGRFPANVMHDGSDEVVSLFPQTTTGGGNKRNINPKNRFSQVPAMTVDAVFEKESGSASRFFYCPKASKKDRNEGLEGFEMKRPDERTETGMGTFTEKGVQPQANCHPTVKPTELMRYLCRLITPPNGTVLDPFIGSGSTGKAAMLEGFQFIGIEREREYFEIAEARIKNALSTDLTVTNNSDNGSEETDCETKAYKRHSPQTALPFLNGD